MLAFELCQKRTVCSVTHGLCSYSRGHSQDRSGSSEKIREPIIVFPIYTLVYVCVSVIREQADN